MNLIELRMKEFEILEQQRDVINSRITEIKNELHEEYLNFTSISNNATKNKVVIM